MNPIRTLNFLARRYLDEKKFIRERERFRMEIISQGFWFIDIPRTGSTSIKQQLGGVNKKFYSRESAGKTQRVLKDHMTYQDMELFLGVEGFRKVRFFSLIRHPVTRLQSIYKYRVLNGEMDKSVTFREFVERLISPRYDLELSLVRSPHLAMQQVSYLCDSKGRLKVDLLGRYENRSEFIHELNTQFGLELQEEIHFEKSTASSHAFDTTVTGDLEDIIRTYFKDDFQAFDY